MDGITVVMIAAVPFEGVTQRPQHFARLLAKRGWDVLYVDAPVSLLGPLRKRELISQLFPSQRVRDMDVPGTKGRLRILSPVATLPFGNRFRFINWLNQRLLAYQIRRNIGGACLLFPLLPGSVDLVSELRPAAVVYDCVDLHEGFGGMMNPVVVKKMEQDLVFASRAVLATSDLLYERMRHLHPEVHLIPNAAEVDHFQTTPKVPVHPLLTDIPEPRVALIGGIGAWVDLDFLYTLAKAKPEAHLVIIGPVETDVSNLLKLQNIHFMGKQPYGDLPQFLAGCAATLVSFVQNELTQGVNPIKVYEYLAADKQVISTANHELLKIADMIWIAEDGYEAAGHLTRILNGERKATRADQQRFSEAHSWSAQVTVVDEILKHVLPPTKRVEMLP